VVYDTRQKKAKQCDPSWIVRALIGSPDFTVVHNLYSPVSNVIMLSPAWHSYPGAADEQFTDYRLSATFQRLIRLKR